MRWRKYGLKLDLTGITKKQAAEIIAKYFNTEYAYYSGNEKEYYSIKDNHNRIWLVDTAENVKPERSMNNSLVKGNFFYQTRITTPLLYERELDILNNIRDNLILKGAVVNDTTRMTVFLDTTGILSTDKFFENLDRVQKSKDKLLRKVLNTEFDKIADTSKLIYENIVSFPLFKSTLNNEAIKSYIQLSQGITNYADRAKTVSEKENLSPNDKFVMRTWLVRLGLIGEECKEARKLLTKDLEGNSAWLNKVDAIDKDAVIKVSPENEKEETEAAAEIDNNMSCSENCTAEEEQENNEPEFYGPSL